MIDRIVQMKASEFDALVSKADANDARIRELAEKYYQERGVFRIDIRSEIVNTRSRDISSSVYSWENGLCKSHPLHAIVTEDFRRKLHKYLKRHVEELFEENYGDFFKSKIFLAEKIDHLRFVKWVCYTIAFSGWGVAAALLILK